MTGYDLANFVANSLTRSALAILGLGLVMGLMFGAAITWWLS